MWRERRKKLGAWAESLSARARVWLRRVMPRVAVIAVALFVVRLLVSGTDAYANTPLRLLGPLTFAAVAVTLLYFGIKVLVRLKRMLLWRVRRRLVITYLFVGLTPIVLLLILGFLAAVGGSSQAFVRVVTVQLSATERQALGGARMLAEGLLELPQGGGDAEAQTWLDERAEVLRSALPGARVYAWRAGPGADPARAGEGAPAQLASVRVDDETRAVGFDNGDARDPLPAWLAGRWEWSGFAYLPPPEESSSAHGTPFVSAVARAAEGGRTVAVLVSVPVCRALVNRIREETGVKVRPFFLGARGTEATGGEGSESGDAQVMVNERGETSGRVVIREGGRVREVDFTRDQFGEPLPKVSLTNFWSPVFLDATEWPTGRHSPQWSFIVDWSWAASGRQFWGNEVMGDFWWQLLYGVGVAFLVLELLALSSAAWMTRAVTGTVHKLHLATEFIKRGDFSHRIRTRSRDQLGELALAFNDMSADIETLLAERVEHERLKREIEIAHEVQAQLFPRSVPELRTVEMTGECRAARGVAGDYYDFVEVAPGLVAFALGDVSGKGLSASLVMSNLQASLRAQVAAVGERVRLVERRAAALAGAGSVGAGADGAQADCEEYVTTAFDRGEAVAAVAASINEQLCSSTDSNRFATLFLGLYDERTREFCYTNAGHNAAALVRADGSVERLTTGGTVVGAFDWVKYEEGRTTLGEGDVLVLFSDGISEAQDAAGEEFGEERLVRFAAAHRSDTAEGLRRGLFDEVDRWTGEAERGDDQTLVILKAVSAD